MDRAQDEALKVSRYNTADWVEAKEFHILAPQITSFVEDSTIVAHNAPFDVSMLKGEYEMASLEHDHLFRDVIDTMALARAFLVPLGLNRIGLGPCMKFIGESYEGAHNAYADAVFAEKLYKYITKHLKWHGQINGKRFQEDLFTD